MIHGDFWILKSAQWVMSNKLNGMIHQEFEKKTWVLHNELSIDQALAEEYIDFLQIFDFFLG